MATTSRRRICALVAPVVLSTAVLAACSGGSDAPTTRPGPATTAPVPAPRPPTTAPTAVSPATTRAVAPAPAVTASRTGDKALDALDADLKAAEQELAGLDAAIAASS